MERLVLDLPLVEVFLIVWLEGLAVITHALRPVSAHLLIFWSSNLAIILIQFII